MAKKRVIVATTISATMIALIIIGYKAIRPSSSTQPPDSEHTEKSTPIEQTQTVSDPKPFRNIKWGEILSERNDMILEPTLAEVTEAFRRGDDTKLESPSQQDTIRVYLGGDQSFAIPNLHIKAYNRNNEKLQFGPESVYRINYEAFDGKFYEVKIEGNPFNLSAIFSQLYGPAKESKIDGHPSWDWVIDDGQTNIHMLYRPDQFSGGYCLITNVKLGNELSALQKAEAAALMKKAQKDF